MAAVPLRCCAAFALALLAACSDGTQPQEKSAAPATEDAFQERIRTMPEAARNAVFIRAIRDAGFLCQHVASSSRMGEGGAPTWSAVCSDSGQWIIAIGANGNAQVTRGAPMPPEQ